MSKKISIGMTIALMLLAAVLTFQITFVVLYNKYEASFEELTQTMDAYKKLADIDAYYREYYVGEIDDEELTDYIMRGYIAGTGDKYAYYLDKEDFALWMDDANAEMQGIGVHVIWTNNMIEIIGVMPDSPALEAGVEPGDYIVMVGDEEVAELGYSEAVSKLQGVAGTDAVFTIYRGGEYIDFTITRGYINETTVMSRFLESDPTIGVIRILEFDLGTPEQFKAAVKDLRDGGATRLIFDVRYNPGGQLTAICEILDYLLPEGPIIRVADKAGNMSAEYSDATELDMPMAVLINESTASAGELFASALQDYGKAPLIGTVTYGKGTMQNIITLSDGSAFGISTHMYYPPFSDCYEGIGVQPDYPCEMDESVANINIYKISDADDTQLMKAVEVLNSLAAE